MYVQKCRRFSCAGKDHCEHYPWRPIQPADLKLPATTTVLINGQQKELGKYTRLYLPGDYPFLLGMTAFWDIRVPVGA